MSYIKTKQIRDLAVRTFTSETRANRWLDDNSESTNTTNSFVFHGVRYTNTATGIQYEAVYSTVSSKWVWIPVESGGANIFLTDSSSPKTGKLADPVDATKKDNLLPGSFPDVFTQIKVDDGEAVNITFEWDGGRDYFGDYKIFAFAADNTLLETLTVSNGNPTDTTGNGASTEVDATNSSISAVSASDRRFQFADVAFDTNKGTLGDPATEVAYFRISGNGGVSDNIEIVRAALAAPVTAASFLDIENRGSIVGTASNHTAVRGATNADSPTGQTYQVTFTIDMTSFAVANAPTGTSAGDVVFELSGEAVEGIYQVTYGDVQTWNATYDTDIAAAAGTGTFDFVIQGIPASTTAANNDLGITITSINAEDAQATSVALGTDSAGFVAPGDAGSANATNGFDFSFDNGNAPNGFGAVAGVPIDNTLIDLSSTSFVYPFYTQEPAVRQLALKTADTTRAAADRATVNFTLNQALDISNGDFLTIVGGGGISTLDDPASNTIGANALSLAAYNATSGALTANVSQINGGTPGLVSGATSAGAGTVTVTAQKARNDSQDSYQATGLRIIDAEPSISSSTPNLFRANGTQTLTFDQQMRFAETNAAVTDGTTTIINGSTALGGITDSTTGTVSVLVDNATIRAVYDGSNANGEYRILGYNVAGFDITGTGLAESLEVRGFPQLAYDPKGASVGSGADFNIVNISGNDWYIQLPGNVEVSSGSFGTNAGPSTGSPSSLSIGNFTIQTSFAVSAVETNYTADPQRIKFTADGSLQTAINNAAAPPATGLTVEETV